VTRNEIDRIALGAPCLWSKLIRNAMSESEANAYTYCLQNLPDGLEAAIHLETDRWFFTAQYRESGVYASPHIFETRLSALDGLKKCLRDFTSRYGLGSRFVLFLRRRIRNTCESRFAFRC
jgi:hypothetical protein